jgi:hypothetical protein
LGALSQSGAALCLQASWIAVAVLVCCLSGQAWLSSVLVVSGQTELEQRHGGYFMLLLASYETAQSNNRLLISLVTLGW